jgi:glycine/D-amino acid oxidase-like deaminating enzyme
MSNPKTLARRSFLSSAGAGYALAQRKSADIPVATVDVVVAGGGPAGVGAALGARRAGARVLLLERHAFFGGVGAWGMGMVINQMRPETRPRGAVHEAVIGRLQTYGEEAMYFEEHAMVTNVEFYKAALFDALDEAGCHYLVHTTIVDSIVERGRIAGIVAGTKQGLRKIRARQVVDATGDADVAFFGGAETMRGREPDSFLSPMTLNFIIVNVDTSRLKEFRAAGGTRDVIKRGRDKYPLLPESISVDPIPIANAVNVNHAGTKLRGVLDGSKPEDLTEAERYMRRQAIQMVRALREYGGPAFARAQLGATGPQAGVRETRRVKGLYILTEDDAKNGSRFDDAIAWRSGFLDIGFVRFEKMKVHDVPYRAIVPAKIDGLVMAGRCISATHVGASSGKSQGNCMATGHAAGLAAAMCAVRNCQPRELRVKDVQAELIKQGVPLTQAGSAT